MSTTSASAPQPPDDGHAGKGEARATLKIGAVARLTGVSVHTLRKWEDRHGAVEPRRTDGGERVYTQNDLDRLRLIKRLAEAGMSLGEVARLSLAELTRAEALLAPGPVPLHLAPSAPVRIAVLGSALAAVLERSSGSQDVMQILASGASLETLEAALGAEPVEVLIVDCPSLTSSSAQRVRAAIGRIGVPAAVVIYRFASTADILSMQAPGVAVLRGPIDRESLSQTVVSLVHAGALVPPPGARPVYSFGADADVSAPRLSREVMARVARTAPRMRCECPHHLADLILSLRAFEEYSADCENHSAEDAALHHYLWRSAALARGLFEAAIERVAEAEGISLVEPDP